MLATVWPQEASMERNEALAYHEQRAREELDRAYRAEHAAASDAHMRLAGLHIERMKQEDGSCGGSEYGRSAYPR